MDSSSGSGRIDERSLWKRGRFAFANAALLAAVLIALLTFSAAAESPVPTEPTPDATATTPTSVSSGAAV